MYELSETASSRSVAAKKGQGPEAEGLWLEAISRIKKDWLRGPRRYTPTGDLRANGELVVVNPAFRFGAQQVDKLRAVGDLRRSSANEATPVKTPTNLSSRGHISQKRMLFDREGESRPNL